VITIIELVLAVLKTINLVMGAVNREQWKKAGRDEVIAEILAQMAERAGVKRRLEEKIYAMDESQIDAELRDLEPKP
jgi:hypothetical protein